MSSRAEDAASLASIPAASRLSRDQVEADQNRPFALYLHVPFCRVRCGYCDFNTYTATELGSGASQNQYSATAAHELDLAARVLAEAGITGRPARTVFFGGGTPTLLPATDLVQLLSAARDTFGFAPNAEVTTEANPDSVDERYLATLAESGFTRISFGMQSAVPHVLRTLDRTHEPSRVAQAVSWARAAGLAVSLDLIYGTPGESPADWQHSVETALDLQPDHISAYALVVEPGTKMGAQAARRLISLPDDDDLAAKYEQADDLFTAGGYSWYEVSNWARNPAAACQHNLGYWRDWDWWGIGPGAHSHVGARRWWNVKHPRAYAQRLLAGQSPVAGSETVSAAGRELERVMLGIRLAEGLDLAGTAAHIPPDRAEAVARLVREGLLDAAAVEQGRGVLTRRGRLLADYVTRELTV